MTTRDQGRRCRAILERQRVTNAALVVVGGHESAEYTYDTASNGRRKRRAPDKPPTAPLNPSA